MRLIVRFERLETIRYISQLDMLRTIHRILRRAEIPVAYSEGFNPQPKVSFAFALSVGLVSLGEYMDIQLKENITPLEFLQRMNNAAPGGMRFTDAAIADDAPKFGKMINCAEFEIRLITEDGNADMLLDKVNAFFAQEEITMERHSKKGTSYINAKPWIYSYKAEKLDDRTVRVTTIQALSEEMSIRVDDIANTMVKYAEGAVLRFTATKINMLLKTDDGFIAPTKLCRRKTV